MAKSKKSKILAMALCASVMTGIYAAPVMAEELYVDSSQSVTTNGVGKTKIASLEGLKEITLGDSVKITTTDGGIIRVGNAGGVNTRVHKDGFYVNTSGDDRKTSLTAGTLTLAGNKLTSAQLVKIKRVVGKVDVVEGKIGGIRRAGTTNENRSTYIEETVRVNNNSGLVVYAEDGTTFAAQIDREGNVLTKGVGRFGALEGPNVRMENGVLSINSEGTNAVASLSKDGLMLSDSVNGQQTLTVAKIADIQHIKHVGNATVIEQNTAISADGIVVKDPGSGVSTKTKYNGFYVKDEYGNNVSSLKNDGLRLTDQESGMQILNATDIADIKGIDRVDTNNDGTLDTTVIEKTLAVSETGIAMSKGDMQLAVNEAGFAAVKGENAIYLNENGVNLSAGNDNFVSVTQDGIGLQGGTSQVIMNSNNGAVFRNGDKAVNGETVINGGSITTNRITTGTVNDVAIGMNANGDITLGNNVVIDGDFNSDNIAGITRVERNDSAPGSEVTYIEKNTAVSADGIVVTDQDTGVSTKTKYDGFYVKDKDSNIVSSLKDDGLMVTDPGSGVSTKTKYDGFYVKDKDRNIVSSLEDDGLMLTDQESGRQILNATDIADIKGIDRVDTNNDGTLDTTVIEKTLAVSETGIAMSKGDMQLAVNEAGFAAVKGENAIYLNENGVNLSAGNDNFVSVTQDGIGLQGGTSQVIMNSNNGAVFRNGDKAVNGETVINGGTITTGTLEVEKIKLGDSMTDKNDNTITIGAAGVIDIEKYGNTVFHADTDNFEAHYNNYDLTLDGTNGFALSKGTSSFTLKGNEGFAFAGPVHLGDGTQVKFRHDGTTDISLSSLVDRVEDLEQKTTGISFDETTGSTTIADKVGTDGVESNNSMTVGNNGTTFKNGEGNGTTNINGSEIVSDATASSTVTGGAGAGTGTVNGGYAEFDKGEGGKTIVDGGNVNVSNKITVGTGTTEITGDHVIVGVHDDNKSNIGKGEATFDKGEDDKTIVNGGNVTTGNITADTGKIGNVEFTADGTTFEDGSENQTVIDKNGIVVGANDGTKIDKDDVSINDKNGGRIHLSDMGQVDNIDAELKQNDNYDDTVVGGINAEADIRRTEVARLDDRITKVEDRVDKVGAMSAAIANLRTMGYDPAAPTEIAVGIGQYRSETGVALGMFHYPNRDFMLSLSVSTSGDEVMGGIGATWKFGRKSPEKVAEIKKAQAEADARRAEEAKLAKAEEMKQAAKEAKIKAQQERHAKLAAQAEAAK